MGNLEISNMNIDHECKKRGVFTNFLYKLGKATEKYNDEYWYCYNTKFNWIYSCTYCLITKNKIR